MKSKILTLLVICAFASPASAQTDHSVFGIELGKPLRVPQCTMTRHYNGKYKYSYTDSTPCFVHGEFLAEFDHPITTPVVNEKVTLYFKTPPAILFGYQLEALVVDGNIELISFRTHGISTADDDYMTLRTKYGKPTTLTRGTVENLAGATFGTLYAEWASAALSVAFKSALSTIDEGRVAIGTPKGMARSNALRDSVDKATAGPKL